MFYELQFVKYKNLLTKKSVSTKPTDFIILYPIL